jgi:peptidase C25-like protein
LLALQTFFKKGEIVMSEFLSLSPSGLPEEFDLELYSEKPVVSVEEREDHIEINYIFPGFTVGDNEQQVDDQTLPFKEVGVSGAGFVSESGKPLLPSFGRFVQIPPGCDYKISTKKSKPVKFDDILITSAQEQATDQANETAEFEYDAETYGEDTLYPADVVQVGEPQNLDDYKVLAIHVRPLQYSPGKRQLVGYSNIKVTIKLSAKEADEEDMEEFPLMDPSVNREGYGNLVLNPRRRIAERMPVNRIPGPIVIRPRGPEFLIIYDDKLKSAAELLADWKNRKGLITEAVSIASVGNSVAKIKKYIRNRRKFFLSRLRYVLLFGDVAAIASEERAGNTTDHYYFTKKDPTNVSDCVLPWVSGGRIPVSSLDDAKAVVQQVIDYERTPPCDPDYYRRMTFAAYFQDDWPQDGRANRAYMKTMEGIRDHMTSIGFAVERVYVSNNPNPQNYKDGTVVPTEVRNAIVEGDDATDMLISETSEGQLAVGHRDHGSETGWSHPSFTKDNLQSILSRYPSIFYSINCLTGRFDYNPSDSFAEDIMELKGGAPSLVAATELSGTWRNDSLMKGLFDAMWPGVIAGFPGTNASYAIKHNRLGDILNYAKSYLLVAHGTNSGVKDHFEIYHVVGDPTLQLWAEEPAPIRLSASIRRNNLNIHVSPAPAEAVVTIWYQGKLVKRAALSSRRISIPVSDLRLTPSRLPTFRRFLHVCVSAPGYRYAQTRIKL